MTDVRAITIRQPWADAVATGAKLRENRGARFPAGYRGPILVHAGTVEDRCASAICGAPA